MSRDELRDMRIRAMTGVPLTSDEQLALVEACERLEHAVRKNGGTDYSARDNEFREQDFRTIGREAVAIIREVTVS